MMSNTQRTPASPAKWIIGCVVVLLVLYSLMRLRSEPDNQSINRVTLDHKNQDAVQRCVSEQKHDIGNIVTHMETIRSCSDPKAKSFAKMFDTIYDLQQRFGELQLPETFQTRVKGWLGNNELLFQEVYAQGIVSIYNFYSRESTVFNPLRGKRPIKTPDQDPVEYIKSIVDDSSEDCDFCNYVKNTAMDKFGRIETKHTITAANTFKWSALHTLLIPRVHDPQHWTEEAFVDLMEVASRWFRKAYDDDPTYAYPSLMWDMLPRASASQLHPHLHANVVPNRYYGTLHNLYLGAEAYAKDTGRDYWNDLINIHHGLGLTIEHGTAVAFAHINPKREREIIVISPVADNDFFVLLHRVLRIYIDDLGMYAWSQGIAFPSMNGKQSLPAISRFVYRGAPTDCRADTSSMELYGQPNVNVDPFQLASSLQKHYHLKF